MSLPLIKRLTKQLATALVVLAMISSDSIGQAPDLEKGLPPQAKPRITNSIGMTMATMDAGVFQMGAPEYVVQVALDGSRFRSGQIFMVDDSAGNSVRFELIDVDTKAMPRLYTPVAFSSGVATNTPSSPEQIAASIATAINAQTDAGKLDITVNVQGAFLNFIGIGLFGAARINTDNDNRVIVRKPDPYASNDERPQHRVELTKSFHVGVTEVTQAQWEAVMESNPSGTKSPHLPVNNISHADAKAFCAKLSALPEEMAAGRSYRLPTEAEWEYLCRAGTRTAFNYGESFENTEQNLGQVLSEYAWFKENADAPQTVAGKLPNQWGLFDLYGNVAEWCEDVYLPSYYGDNPPGTDPTGPATGSQRVLRGGSYMSQPSSCRSSYRGSANQLVRSRQNGLRVVCVQQ
jgi:formylglycine-generating enzyme required for sulfatase activity